MKKLSYNKLSIFFLILFAIFAATQFFVAQKLPLPPGLYVTSPGFYPSMISVLIFISCVVGIITTLRKKDKSVEIPSNYKNILLVFVIIFLWILLWKNMGYFYLVSMLCMGLLIYFLNPSPNSFIKIRNTVFTDLIIILVFYIVFQNFLGVNL